MFEKFSDIELKFLDIEKKISDPDIISDQKKYQTLLKEHSHLKVGVELYRSYQNLKTQLDETKEMLSDPELGEMAKEEHESLSQDMAKLSEELQMYLIPPDPDE